MCGWGGELRLDGRPADVVALAGMAPCLRSRGPDGHGTWAEGSLPFVHHRLRIIDLSDAGAPEAIARLLADPNSERTTLGGNVLWQVGLLEMWLQRMGV